jgi:hypothetical protein
MAHPIPPDAGSTKLPLKVFVSLSLFAITYLLTTVLTETATNTDVVVGLGASLFVAGVAFIVQFLYDLEKRLARMEQEYSRHATVNEQRINEGFEKINEATKLFSLVEASALRTDEVTKLVSRAVQIKPSPELIFDLAQHEIARLSDLLKTLGNEGDATYEGEDRDWMLALTRSVTSTLDATSTTVDVGGHDFLDGSLWQSDLGQRYLEAQRDAIRRGVRVRRIFILDHPELRDDLNFRKVVSMQDDIGIEVRAMDPTLMPGQFIPPVFDLIIFDGVVSYQATPTARVNHLSRQNIASTQLITTQASVRSNIDRFNALWQVATPIT